MMAVAMSSGNDASLTNLPVGRVDNSTSRSAVSGPAVRGLPQRGGRQYSSGTSRQPWVSPSRLSASSIGTWPIPGRSVKTTAAGGPRVTCSSKEFYNRVTLPSTRTFCSGEHTVDVIAEDGTEED